MYILVNKDIKISKGKLAGQVGHAVNVYIYNMMNGTQQQKNIIEEYMEGDIKKIILYDTEHHLLQLEKKGHITIRDKGYTQLDPNTLTCVNLGIVAKEDIILNYLKDLKLV